MDVDAVLGGAVRAGSPHLTERQRRLLLGAGARALGRGGGARMARLSGMSRPTVYAGWPELEEPPDPQGRVRRPGGGPKRLRDTDPGLVAALEALVDPDTRGDPGSPLRWTCKSTRELAEVLTAQGHPVSDDTVGRLLKQEGYRLQRTVKTLEGAQHQDRDAYPLGSRSAIGSWRQCRSGGTTGMGSGITRSFRQPHSSGQQATGLLRWPAQSW